MTASISAGPPLRLSVPPKLVAPRQLTDAEVGTLCAIADVLIPAVGDNPAATSEPDFDQWLARAADARADAFDDITAVLAQLEHAAPDTIDQTLRALHADQPRQFQALSAVVAGAWLLVRRCARGSDIPASGAIPRAWKKRPTRSPTASSTPSSPAAPSTRQTPPARTDTAMRWTKVLNVVECDVGGEVAKVMTGGVVASIALVIARAANILG